MSTPERVGGPAKGPGHGGPARGYSWKQFEPGHELSMRHGAYSSALRLAPRTQEIAESLRDAIGEGYDEKFAPAIEVGSLALARVERAMGPLLELNEDAI